MNIVDFPGVKRRIGAEADAENLQSLFIEMRLKGDYQRDVPTAEVRIQSYHILTLNFNL